MKPKHLITLTALALSLLLGSCTNKATPQPSYAEHLVTQSDATGKITIVSGAPVGSNVELEMANAKTVTHTFSDGLIRFWENHNGVTFLESLDYGATEADQMQGVIVDREARLKAAKESAGTGVQSQALTIAKSCGGSELFLLCIGTPPQYVDPDSIIAYDYSSEIAVGSDWRNTIEKAVQIWNSKLNTPGVYTNLRWVYDPKGSNKITFRLVSEINLCGRAGSIGYRENSAYAFIELRREEPSFGRGACGSKLRTTLHEMGHKMGLYHEQARCDRTTNGGIEFFTFETTAEKNAFIGRALTREQEISSTELYCASNRAGVDDAQTYNDTNSHGAFGPYDHFSVMHYTFKRWERIAFRFKEMSTEKEELLNTKIGFLETPSEKDILAVADLYRVKCPVLVGGYSCPK